MGSRFDERWSRTAEPLLAKHFSPTGAVVSYLDGSFSTAKTIAGPLITREKASRRQDDPMGGWRIVTTRTIRYPQDGNPKPRVDGTFTIDGQVYAVEVETKIENERFECELIRVEAGEIARQDYRR